MQCDTQMSCRGWRDFGVFADVPPNPLQPLIFLLTWLVVAADALLACWRGQQVEMGRNRREPLRRMAFRRVGYA